MNNYEKLIQPYLIDFDKLKKGDTLWSVTDGEVKIFELLQQCNLCICIKACKWYDKNGKSSKSDKYPTLFSADPFENLVEPLEFDEKPFEEPFTPNPETIKKLQAISAKYKPENIDGSEVDYLIRKLKEKGIEVYKNQPLEEVQKDRLGEPLTFWGGNPNIKSQPLESVEAEAERQSENHGFPNTYKKAFKAGAEYAQNITIKN